MGCHNKFVKIVRPAPELNELEFPEFLDVFFSNPLKLFTEVGIRMLGRAFFWRRRRFLTKISSIRLKALSIKEMEER
jgi:hypothetical protein